MRISSGTHRGRKLTAVRAAGIRPTSIKVRQAVFNILASRMTLVGSNFLDLFAGTGAVGIDALSRGAASVSFVERDAEALEVLTRNLEVLGLADRARIESRLDRVVGAFDAVFADPPYAEKDVDLNAAAGRLREGGYLIFETELKTAPPIAGLEPVRSYHYGRTWLHLYSREIAS